MSHTNFRQVSLDIKNRADDILFHGIWLKWHILTLSEKVVCLGILLIPLWWVIGWGIMLLPWVGGICIYELKQYKRIRLSKPSLEVIGIILFAFQQCISYALNSPEIAPRLLIDPFVTWGCGGIILWYIQSHKIFVRYHVVAWAFSVLICFMLFWWLFFHFILREPYFVPPRTLYAVLTDKGTFNASKLGSVGNFLVPYYFGEPGFGGLYRYTFFFAHPTVSSFAIGFAGLVILDVKKRYWSWTLCIICSVLIVICQARNAWLSLAAVLFIRWLLTSAKDKGIAFILLLFAITSFVTLSVPSVTSLLMENYNQSVEATSNFRKDSTDVRYKIYLRTWEDFIKEPLLGHGVPGSPVLPGYEFALTGTESFLLGCLFYRSGLLGTGIFMTFFIPFLTWLYQTRKQRPLSAFLMLLYFIISSLVTDFMGPEIFIVLLCVMLYKSPKYNYYSQNI
ncbi:O-antigen polymerase [Nostoc carneum NIES-2107]|nr:O-antigen polymerase [Nostoc carneum NIES-2107]